MTFLAGLCTNLIGDDTIGELAAYRMRDRGCFRHSTRRPTRRTLWGTSVLQSQEQPAYLNLHSIGLLDTLRLCIYWLAALHFTPVFKLSNGKNLKMERTDGTCRLACIAHEAVIPPAQLHS